MNLKQRREELERQLAERDQLIEGLKKLISQQQEKIQELEAKLAKDSHTSSKPPSSDGMKRRHSSKRKPRPTGGQSGHEEQTLRKSEVPDEVVIHRPEVCENCHAALKNIPGEIDETRQVMDIPPPAKLMVTEHQVERVQCPHCGKHSAGAFPQEVKVKVQYGPELRSLAVYFSHYHHISLERTCEALEDLVGVHISEGTVQAWVEEAGRTGYWLSG